MQLYQQILDLLRQKSKGEFEYINPNFLLFITEALESYYDASDDDVNRWVQDMFSA